MAIDLVAPLVNGSRTNSFTLDKLEIIGEPRFTIGLITVPQTVPATETLVIPLIYDEVGAVGGTYKGILKATYNTDQTLEIPLDSLEGGTADALIISGITETGSNFCNFLAGSECTSVAEYEVVSTGGGGTLTYSWNVIPSGIITAGQGTSKIELTTTGSSNFEIAMTCTITDSNGQTSQISRSFLHSKEEGGVFQTVHIGYNMAVGSEPTTPTPTGVVINDIPDVSDDTTIYSLVDADGVSSDITTSTNGEYGFGASNTYLHNVGTITAISERQAEQYWQTTSARNLYLYLPAGEHEITIFGGRQVSDPTTTVYTALYTLDGVSIALDNENNISNTATFNITSTGSLYTLTVEPDTSVSSTNSYICGIDITSSYGGVTPWDGIHRATKLVAEQPTLPGVFTDPLEEARWSNLVELEAGYSEYFVSPTGLSTNNGTEASPWDLTSAIDGTRTIPDNSIIWLLAGDYISPFTPASTGSSFPPPWNLDNIHGTTNRAIHIRPKLGDIVRVDSGFSCSGIDYFYVWDIEFTDLSTEGWQTGANITDGGAVRDDYLIPVPSAGYDYVDGDFYNNCRKWVLDKVGTHQRLGLEMSGIGTGNKLINNTVHKCFTGPAMWSDQANGEIYGNVAFDNGYVSFERRHGTGIYQHNESGTPRTCTDNITCGDLSVEMQMTTGTGVTADSMTAERNVSFALRKLGTNVDYFAPRGDVQYGTSGTNQVFNNNYCHAHNPQTGLPEDVVFTGNELRYGQALAVQATPELNIIENWVSERKVDIIPNKYDPRRANMVVTNKDREALPKIDVSAFVADGQRIRVYNMMQSVSVPVVDVVFDSTVQDYIEVPMDGSPNFTLTKYGSDPENPSDVDGDYSTLHREFWAFVLIKG